MEGLRGKSRRGLWAPLCEGIDGGSVWLVSVAVLCVRERSEPWVGAQLNVIVTEPVCEGASLAVRSM